MDKTKKWGSERFDLLSIKDVMNQLIRHEDRHQGMLSFFDDMFSIPGEEPTPTPIDEFRSQNSGWFKAPTEDVPSGIPVSMEWVLDLSPAQIFQRYCKAMGIKYQPKNSNISIPIGRYMIDHAAEVVDPKNTNSQTEDRFRCYFDLTQSHFPKEYYMAKTTPIIKK